MFRGFRFMPDDVDTSSAYAQLRGRYAASLENKRNQFASAWSAIRENPDDHAAGEWLATLIHQLCGSAVAYGFPGLGDQACRTGLCLRQHGLADAALASEMEALFSEFERAETTNRSDPG